MQRIITKWEKKSVESVQHISIKHTHIFISNKCTQSPTLTYLSNKYTHTHTHSHSHSHSLSNSFCRSFKLLHVTKRAPGWLLILSVTFLSFFLSFLLSFSFLSFFLSFQKGKTKRLRRMIEQGCVGDRACASAFANNQQRTNRTNEQTERTLLYESTVSLLIVKTLSFKKHSILIVFVTHFCIRISYLIVSL